ncbi:hypothetical protein ACFP81_00370 [Deinococcus lacus]|uniref:Uncharacterized protein n=1 Tax=Deinococcus lacus TaxID=392561 RepID=A0ABW1YB32_9DEIO
MRAYKGVVKNGVVEVQGASLPEGVVVTVTVGEPELLHAHILNLLRQARRGGLKLRPNPSLSAGAAGGSSGTEKLLDESGDL